MRAKYDVSEVIQWFTDPRARDANCFVIMDDRRPLLPSTSDSENDWACPEKQVTLQARKKRVTSGKRLVVIFVVSFDTRHGAFRMQCPTASGVASTM